VSGGDNNQTHGVKVHDNCNITRKKRIKNRSVEGYNHAPVKEREESIQVILTIPVPVYNAETVGKVCFELAA
jgi:hypothetical protein